MGTWSFKIYGMYEDPNQQSDDLRADFEHNVSNCVRLHFRSNSVGSYMCLKLSTN